MYGDATTVRTGGISLGKLVFYALVVIVACIALMAFFHLGPFTGTTSDNETSGMLGQQDKGAVGNRLQASTASLVSLTHPAEDVLASVPSHEVTIADIKSLSGQTEPYAFNLAAPTTSDTASSEESADDTSYAVTLSDTSQDLLANATAYYSENDSSAGYLLLDLQSGRGIAANLDERIYGASSIKGPFCTYVSEALFPNSEEDLKAPRKALVEKTILYSDNDSYQKLRRDYAGLGFDDWLTEAGVRTGLVTDTYYPEYSARESALLWLKTYNYLEGSGTSTAAWLSDLFEQTQVSFLRNGIVGTHSVGGAVDATKKTSEETASSESTSTESASESVTASDSTEAQGDTELASETGDLVEIAITDADGAETLVETSLSLPFSTSGDVVVRNKAGWIAGVEDDAICDSGIVTANGRDYLVVIMTSARDTIAAEKACANLATTLMQIRGDLAA